MVETHLPLIALTMAAISEGQVQVYDRQLRLWGVQAQQRLLNSKVLVWGLSGTNVEVCKNLVLAGVSLTVRDHRLVESADVAFNYFLREEDIGKKRAECAAQRVQEMNQLTVVSAIASAPEKGEGELKEALKEFDIVCVEMGVLGWDVNLACLIDQVCRTDNAGFILSVSAGERAFFFSDFHEHVVQERSSVQGAGATAPEQKPISEQICFASFSEWLQVPASQLQQDAVNSSIIFVSEALTFIRKDKGLANVQSAPQFAEFCANTAKCVPNVDGVASIQDAFRCLFVEPLVHVASILGGLLTQEVIKAITKRDPPLVNSVCFNAHTSVAFVERIPQFREPSKKRKIEESFDIDD